MVLACLAVLWRRRMNCSSSPAGLQDPFPSPTTCIAGIPGAAVLCSGVGSCAGSSGGSLQNAPEGSFGTCGPAGSMVFPQPHRFTVWAHWRGVRLPHYLDDWLIIAELRDPLLKHRELVFQLCKDLGIFVNWEKSFLQPSTWV